jgi:hypothetical protein
MIGKPALHVSPSIEQPDVDVPVVTAEERQLTEVGGSGGVKILTVRVANRSKLLPRSVEPDELSL